MTIQREANNQKIGSKKVNISERTTDILLMFFLLCYS